MRCDLFCQGTLSEAWVRASALPRLRTGLPASNIRTIRAWFWIDQARKAVSNLSVGPHLTNRRSNSMPLAFCRLSLCFASLSAIVRNGKASSFTRRHLWRRWRGVVQLGRGAIEEVARLNVEPEELVWQRDGLLAKLPGFVVVTEADPDDDVGAVDVGGPV